MRAFQGNAFQSNAFQSGASSSAEGASFLVVGEIIVPVAIDGADGKSSEHRLDRMRTHGGVMHRSRQGVWRAWSITTRTMTKSDAIALKAQLTTNAQPVRCEGELFKSESPTNGVHCFVQFDRWSPSAARGDRWVMEFQLFETSVAG